MVVLTLGFEKSPLLKIVIPILPDSQDKSGLSPILAMSFLYSTMCTNMFLL